jgi:acid phosphatase
MLCLLWLLAGCGDDNTMPPSHDMAGGNKDLSGVGDMAMGGGNDLAGADLAGADLATPPGDMAMGSGDMAMQTGQFGTIFTIIMENTNASDIIGSANAPFINGTMIAQGGLATMYKDSGTHPSLPNYLYMTSGNVQYEGGADYDPTQKTILGTQFPVKSDNLGNQLTGLNVPWRAYAEAAGGNCVLASAGTYACKHVPFLYYDDIQNGANGLCANHVRDFTADFVNDLGAGTYKYMWITPDLNDDGHDTDLKTVDGWLMKWIPMITASQAYQNNGVIFLTWDEGSGFINNDSVPMIIMSPKIKQAGYTSATAYTHANFLATVEDIFGAPRLGAAAAIPNMLEFFK